MPPMAPPPELLANVDLFRDLDRRELHEIAGGMKEYRFSPGHEIVTQGRDGVGFFVIADGTAKVSVDGGEVRTLGTGDYFGEIALLAESPRTATVTAESDVICWGLVSWAFRPIVEANGSIAWKLLQAMARIVADK
jgi:CRP-like cAMP-binding protein